MQIDIEKARELFAHWSSTYHVTGAFGRPDTVTPGAFATPTVFSAPATLMSESGFLMALQAWSNAQTVNGNETGSHT